MATCSTFEKQPFRICSSKICWRGWGSKKRCTRTKRVDGGVLCTFQIHGAFVGNSFKSIRNQFLIGCWGAKCIDIIGYQRASLFTPIKWVHVFDNLARVGHPHRHLIHTNKKKYTSRLFWYPCPTCSHAFCWPRPTSHMAIWKGYFAFLIIRGPVTFHVAHKSCSFFMILPKSDWPLCFFLFLQY